MLIRDNNFKMAAGVLCIVCQIFLLHLLRRTSAGIENIDLNYTHPIATFDELFNDGIELYSKGSWRDAIRSLELSLADFRHEGEVRANCLLKCREDIDKSKLLKSDLYDGGSLVLYYSIRVKRCCDRCKERFMGRRAPVARIIRQAFEEREPYNYLQFAYYKTGQVVKAADAAYTFLEKNQNDQTMEANLAFYLEHLGTSNKTVNSMEPRIHMELFKQGDEAYKQENYADCVYTFEEALDEYYSAYSKCQALCEFQHEKHQASFSVALFGHYTAVVECRLSCADTLAVFNGRVKEKFLQDHYHYLQFCYYEVGNVKDAAISAKTYLLFHPDDPIMNANMKYYMKNQQVQASEIKPRSRAVDYQRQRQLDRKLLLVAKYYADPDSAFDEERDLEQELEGTSLFENENNKKKEPTKGDDGTEEFESSMKKFRRPRALRDQDRWKRNPLFNGTEIFKEEEELNGTERVAVDGLATQEECNKLMDLVKKFSVYGDGYDHQKRIKRQVQDLKQTNKTVGDECDHSLAVGGDGYQHSHKDPKHPFTEKETFEGLSILTAAEAIAKGTASLEAVELYANLSRKAIKFTEDYFDLKLPLHFAFTHLVCRTALSDDDPDSKPEEWHISHPVHSDNCILGADGPGTCPKRAPAYTWRDYSAIMYLNDDFSGGDFIFADAHGKMEAAVKPKCGRLVAFGNGIENIHGVLGVRKGIRCALPLWFTFSADNKEDSRHRAERIIRRMRDEKMTEQKLKVENLSKPAEDKTEDEVDKYNANEGLSENDVKDMNIDVTTSSRTEL